MPDHETRSEIRKSRTLLEHIESELAGHIRREHDRDMRNTDRDGRLQGRLDRIEHSLAELGKLIENLDAKLEGHIGAADR